MSLERLGRHQDANRLRWRPGLFGDLVRAQALIRKALDEFEAVGQGLGLGHTKEMGANAMDFEEQASAAARRRQDAYRRDRLLSRVNAAETLARRYGYHHIAAKLRDAYDQIIEEYTP